MSKNVFFQLLVFLSRIQIEAKPLTKRHSILNSKKSPYHDIRNHLPACVVVEAVDELFAVEEEFAAEDGGCEGYVKHAVADIYAGGVLGDGWAEEFAPGALYSHDEYSPAKFGVG